MTVSPAPGVGVLDPQQDELLGAAGEREIRLYFPYAEANVVRAKIAQIVGDRAAVSRLRAVEGGWVFTIQRNGDAGPAAEAAARRAASEPA